MFSPSSPRDQTYESPSPSDEIPDPYDWIQEHHSLACVARTLSDLKQTPDESISEGVDFSYTPEGELVIDLKTREMLKAHCGEQHWQYVRKYI
ncbi:hypothetical protein ACL6C3_21075 [Capilliphycus salinus ALCB114379]|uniref:hypothetical protein n=1 Tax=Capilliphycus salinus TaxID=2768948 RepID=UPI0039A4BF53